MRLYLTVRPEDVREAAPYRRELLTPPIILGRNPRFCGEICWCRPAAGLLVLSDRGAPPVEDPEGLAGALLRECGRRSYSGIVLDFEMPPRGTYPTLPPPSDGAAPAGHPPSLPPGSVCQINSAPHRHHQHGSVRRQL